MKMSSLRRRRRLLDEALSKRQRNAPATGVQESLLESRPLAICDRTLRPAKQDPDADGFHR